MNGLHGIIFSYEQEPGLRELAERRMPASIPFGGRYRVVDFMLSNLHAAGITDVGVVLHGNYQSLLDHIGNGKTWDMARKYGGLRILPPFADTRAYRSGEFRGKMEALAGVRSYLQGIRQDYVVLSDSDLIINLPLADVFAAHLESGADITAVCTANGGFVDNATYRSLEIYILSKQLLLTLVDECSAQDKYSFRRDVLAGMTGRLKLRSYVWDGYAAQLRSVQEYYDRSMELLQGSIRAELFAAARPILAKDDEASSYFAPGSRVKNSLVADGCTIEGSVENCILFPGVTVEKGAELRDSILFKGTRVRDGVTLRYVITDKYVEVLPGRTLMGHESYPIVISKGSIV